jgi:8-oxo-dGTP pyrophosphatase MutT (NUDIX family)
MLKLKIMKTLPSKQKIQIVTIAENQLLLLQFAKFYDGGFQNITGSVENGETFQQAAERELFEEIGIRENLIDIDYTIQFNDRWGFEVIEKIFLCELDKIPKITISEEHKSYKWVPCEKITPQDFVFPTNFRAFQKALEFEK